MHTFAQKPKATQQTTSAKSTILGRGHLGQSPEVKSILHVQRTIGNQAVQRMLQADAGQPEAKLTGTPSPSFGHDLSRIPNHPPAAGAIQTKLVINELGDSYEQEADRVAEQVMRTPVPQLQRACPCGGACPKCQKNQPSQEHERLQTKRVQVSDTGQIAAPPTVHEVLRSPGQPLDPAIRAFMEPRFGHDFSRVRVHSSGAAEQSARDIGANAYVVGQDVVFGAGQFTPMTHAGRQLLAHELTHVVQQTGKAQVIQRSPDETDDDDDEVPARTKLQRPVDVNEGVYENLRGLGVMTQEELDALVERLTDPEVKRTAAEGNAAEAKRKEEEQDGDATRHQRLNRFAMAIDQRKYVPEDVLDMIRKQLSGRDLQVLKRFGFKYYDGIRTRKNFRKSTIEAIRKYDEEWQQKHSGQSIQHVENRKLDEFLTVVKADTARAQAAYDPEAMGAITGGFFGAICYGIGGDEGAKFCAPLDGVVQSLGGTVRARPQMPHYSPVRRTDPIADVRGAMPANKGGQTPSSGTPQSTFGPDSKPIQGGGQNTRPRQGHLRSMDLSGNLRPPPTVKPPPDLTREPAQKALPPPDTRQLTLEVEQAQQRWDRLREKASQAEKHYGKLRNTARAIKRRGQQLTQQEADLLATKRKLEQARDDARSKLNQAKERLRVLQPSEGVPKHGEAGLAQESKYLDELQGRGLRAQLTGKNTPVIDAAIVGTPEVHSVKSIVPSAGSDVAVRLAEKGSPRDLADRVGRHITKALMDRRSDKWSRLRNRWNNTMRASHADQFGYELPKNPDNISFVVDVRVVSAKAPSATAQQAVEAAVTTWLKNNERVPPHFTWRIVYVSNQ